MKEINGNVDEQSASTQEITSSLSIINGLTKDLYSDCVKTGQGIKAYKSHDTQTAENDKMDQQSAIIIDLLSKMLEHYSD